MSYSIRHQIFVSSTFTDLIEERAEVIQALWELDCIPTGMEAFVASNESQWSVIKRVIDECDYYVLIIGGRYGSVADEGISYTEKEYRYAKKIGLPVLAFVHGNPDQIPAGKSEKDEQLRRKLEVFRAEVKKDHPVGIWASASELGGLVSRSLVREIKVNPRPGWIRNDGSSPVALLETISKLTEENAKLREEVLANKPGDDVDDSLASGSNMIVVYGMRTLFDNSSYSRSEDRWRAKTTWDELFKDIGPALINETTEVDLQEILSRFNGLVSVPSGYSVVGNPSINLESWNEVLIQFRALGLIDQGIKKRGVNDKGSYWRITAKGDKALVGLLAQRKPTDPNNLADILA
ncbi:DUF4062 domain-containing protein [Mesorhizobium sp. M0088]|uniref:DUF4062 domain-containing protein n=1 Tax=Mesorhizobium sp. M0088 TaxID=2956873 RepID=UPI00333BE880